MVDVGMTLEMVEASQMGMKAIGAALAVGLTGIASGIAEMTSVLPQSGRRPRTVMYSVWCCS